MTKSKVLRAFVPFTHVLLGVQPVPGLALPSANRPPDIGTDTPNFADFDACRKWTHECVEAGALTTSQCAFNIAQGQERRLLNFLHNTIRRCPSCGKANAQTLDHCNGCGDSLAHVGVCETPNEFAGFVLSVGKVHANDEHALEISLRHECPDFIVADDKHSLSPCHVNCVPTKQIVPDWRYLLRKPRAGLALIRQMKAHCLRVVRTQFFMNEEWASTYVADGDRALRMARSSPHSQENTPASLAAAKPGDHVCCLASDRRRPLSSVDANRGSTTPPTTAAARAHTACVRSEPSIGDDAFYAAYLAAGFNHPPSQNQLHLQCMYPGLVPYQYWMFQRHQLFTEGRFFTFEYVEAALCTVAAVGVPPELLHHDVPVAALISHLKEKYGLDAAVFHRDFVHRFDRLFHEHEPWYPLRGVRSSSANHTPPAETPPTTAEAALHAAVASIESVQQDAISRGECEPPTPQKDEHQTTVAFAPSGRLQFRYVAVTSAEGMGKERLLAVPVGSARCSHEGGDADDSDSHDAASHHPALHEVVLDQVELKKVVDDDRRAMQGFGRPYVDGKPRGKYYAHPPQKLSDLVFW